MPICGPSPSSRCSTVSTPCSTRPRRPACGCRGRVGSPTTSATTCSPRSGCSKPWSRRASGARVVYASSSSVYGNQPRYPTHEDDLPEALQPLRGHETRGASTCAASTRRTGAFPRSRCVTSRSSVRASAPTCRSTDCARRRFDGTAFPRYGDGSQIREFTFVDDIVRGNLLAAERDVAPGTYCNLAGGGEITLSDLIALVGELAGAPLDIDEQPRQAGDAFRNGGSIRRAARPARLEAGGVAARRARRAARMASCPVVVTGRAGNQVRSR